MLTYPEEFGADIAGNRGTVQTCAELEPSDRDEVREQISAQYEQDVDEYIIYLYDHLDNEHEFEVLASDYFTYDEIQEL
jgi:hypothetical protein